MRVEWTHQGRTFALETPTAVRIDGPDGDGWYKILPKGCGGFILELPPSADLVNFQITKEETRG